MSPCRHFVHVPGLLLALLLAACWGEPQYPPQLVQADSLLMQGEYERADSLLHGSAPRDGERHAVSMYRTLLEQLLRYKQLQPTDNGLVLADSLCRFYDGFGTPEKHAEALFLMGYAYYDNDNYAAAADCYQHAYAEAAQAGNLRLQAWIARQQGDILFDQTMYNESIEPYRRYDALARQTGDRRQMSLAQFGMGRVYTILGDADSAIYAYNQSILLAHGLPDSSKIIPFCQNRLADIYIQVEEYDSAAMYMRHDSISNPIWADLYAALGRTDSAVYYYAKALNRAKHDHTSLHTKAEQLRLLIALERGRGNQQAVLQYYSRLVSTEDSIKAQSAVADTRKVKARYELDLVKHERDQLAAAIRNVVYALVAFVLIAILAALLVWQRRQAARQHASSQQRQLRLQQELAYQQSEQKLEDNQQRLQEVSQALQQAEQQHDEQASSALKLETEMLTTENKAIEAARQRRRHYKDELKSSDLYNRICRHAGQPDFWLTDEEWTLLGDMIDRAYNNFSRRLVDLGGLSQQELHICYLVLLRLKPAAVASMVQRGRSAVTQARTRMYKKLTGKDGSPKDFDKLILDF